MRKLPPLATLRAFEAAARHLSFKRAAQELAVTPTAVSHQIRLLEASLGVRLFERRTRQVALTAEGQGLYPVLRDGFDTFAAAIERIAARKARRIITLTATMAFTAKWLVPRIASFRDANPMIGLRLYASDEVVDLRSGEADAAIRYGRGPFPGMIAEPLVTDRYAPVCSPRLKLRGPEDLHRYPLLHSEWRRIDAETPTWRLWCKRAGLTSADVERDITFTDDSHAIQAAVAAQGVALVSLILVADELASGTLIQPFGPVLQGWPYHFLYPETARRREDLAAVQHWLHTTVQKES
jgi:LysR family glycine cleavage system transcriptional activator